MNKKKIGGIFILIILVFAAGMYPIIFKNESSSRDSNTLKIYLLGSGDNYDIRMKSIISEFEKRYPDMKIEKVIFDMNEGDGIEGYVKKMLTDSLAGDGPDILLLDSLSTRKLEKSGTLLDLKPLLEKDNDFNEGDYNMKVMDAGLYEGKQLVMPLDYYVNQYITTKELLNSNGINLDVNCSQEDFFKSIDEYIKVAEKDKTKLLFGAPVNIEDFIAGSGEKFIDYDKKEVHFDNPDFKKILDNYKKVYKSTIKSEEMIGVSGDEGFQGLKNGNILLSNDPIDVRDKFFEYESLIKGACKETSVIGTLSTYKNGNVVVPIVGMSLAISTNTKNEEAAYNFIKIAISEEIQNSRDIPQHIPINKKAAEELQEQYNQNEVNKTYKFDRDTIVVTQPLSNEFTQYYNKILNDLGDAQITNYDMEKLIKETMLPYFQDKEPYESCINILENKVKIYLNE